MIKIHSDGKKKEIVVQFGESDVIFFPFEPETSSNNTHIRELVFINSDVQVPIGEIDPEIATAKLEESDRVLRLRFDDVRSVMMVMRMLQFICESMVGNNVELAILDKVLPENLRKAKRVLSLCVLKTENKVFFRNRNSIECSQCREIISFKDFEKSCRVPGLYQIDPKSGICVHQNDIGGDDWEHCVSASTSEKEE